MAQRSLFGITREVLKDLLTCRICFEMYDGSTRFAKFLPCMHGFCVVCLAGLARDEPQFKCPECRRDTPVPENGVQGFPDNFIAGQLKDLEHLLDVNVTRPHGLHCGSCISDGGPAVSFCSHADCVTFLCHTCDQAHRTMRKFDDHAVCAIEDLQKQPEILLHRHKIQCELHKHDLTVFCNEEGCQRPLCLVCVPTAHQGHRVVDLDQKSSEVKEELQSLAQAVGEKTAPVKEISERIESEISETRDRKAKMSTKISKMFGELHTKLQNRNDEVISELEKRAEERIQHLRHLGSNARSLVSQFESASQFAERSCEIGNAVDLLGTRGQIISRLHELIAYDINASESFQPAGKAFLSLKSDHNQVLEEFEKLLPSLGCLDACTGGTVTKLMFTIDFPDDVGSTLPVKATHKVRISSVDPSSPSLESLSGCLGAYLQSPDGSTVECVNGEQCGEFYELQFRPLVAGPHQLNISVSGVPITGSPFPVVVVDTTSSPVDDGQAEQSQDEVCSDLTWTDAFVQCEHKITVKFQAPEHRLPRVNNLSAWYSMPWNQDQEDTGYAIPDKLTASNETEAQIVETNDSQTFRIVYTPPDAGKLIMSVFMNGQPIANSPFVINVNPLHPDSTIVSSHQLGKCQPNTAVLDMPFKLTLLTCDHHGERLTTGGYNITASVTISGSSESLQRHCFTDNRDGSHTVTITPRSVKLHFVSITICGNPVKSPLEISVVDSLPFEDPPTGFEKPTGLDVDTNSHTVYVVDMKKGGRVCMFESDDGSFMSEWAIGESLCKKSSQIAVNNARQLVLLVSDLKLVLTYNIQGSIVSKWKCATDNRKPANLALSREGHVIVGDSQSQELFIYQPKSEVMGRIQLPEGALARGINNVCVDHNQNLLVVTHSEPNRILRYTMTGALISILESPTESCQLAVASTPEGALIVSMLHGILVLEFSHDLMEVAKVKEFRTDYIYTKLAVVTDGCFVAFDPGAKHLAKYSYQPKPSARRREVDEGATP
ncbi:uncharacterized protein LOC119736237 [Patiria miniata]|uniref:RING-type domain-containing protein n=1 Tax=Patiria miniata TaxID=46514 RepID=A0A914AR08_PATMI|nr:uncharacterized protein LOC119736237 [Patiria miniata]